ncbi:glycosyltransferase, partial [Klebsiella pneumoniae]
MGACYSRNILIHQAKGEFVTGLDDDDYFFPERLELFISFGELNKYSFICANVTIASTERIKTREGGMVISLDEMKNFNAVGNQIFVKKHIIESVGGFDTD